MTTASNPGFEFEPQLSRASVPATHSLPRTKAHLSPEFGGQAAQSSNLSFVHRLPIVG